ncbi:hypothetical protein [Halodesulfovibrio aestuarii]|uniref:hypothetical protein n=1 Tax=Halodesulfovibrio aestuarii TaxID=126333 RepID=UPI0003FF1F05
MKKNILILLFLAICCNLVMQSVANATPAKKDLTYYRKLYSNPLATTFLSVDAYKDKSPVTKEHLKHAFAEMMAWKYKNGLGVVHYKDYSIFKEMKVTWAGDTSAAISLIQSLYKNDKVIDSLKTTYFFTLDYTHNIEKSLYEVRCIVNDMVVESATKEPEQVFDRHHDTWLWPPSGKEQDEKVLSLFDRESRYFFNRSVRFKRVEKYHAEIVTALDKKYVQQMLRQHIPAKRSDLRVTDDGVFWREIPIITIIQEDGHNKISADFDLHYTVSMDGRQLEKMDAVPYEYLRKTFGKSLVRCDMGEEQLKNIRKYTVEEYLKKLGTFIFAE